MTNRVYERWVVEERPIFRNLPGLNGGYSENQVADWLTKYWDDALVGLFKGFDNLLDKQLDPLTCDPEYLDFLASLAGFTGPYWDRTWPVAAKRKLIEKSMTLIWPYKGTGRVLSYVLNAFDIRHILQEGSSFIIGEDEVGEALGFVAWNYTILLPDAYYKKEKETLARRLDLLFGPCWCSKSVEFSNQFFKVYEALGFMEEGAFTVLSAGEPKTGLEI